MVMPEWPRAPPAAGLCDYMRFCAGRRAERGRVSPDARRCLLAIAVAGALISSPAVPWARAGEAATYSAKAVIPVPPASKFAGSGGGDGWALALSEKDVYNVFHHSKTLQVACHLQSTAAQCFAPETITDLEHHDFSTSGQPGLYLDQATGRLYVYATRTSDGTGGVVCINTALAPNETDPFCGFVPLTKAGESPLTPTGISGTSDPMLVGSRWYAFNYVNGVGHVRAENALLCFELSTAQPCAGQPYALNLGEGDVADEGMPSPATAAIGTQLIVPVEAGGADRLACFDASREADCAGSWPLTLKGPAYAGHHGAAVPELDPAGEAVGLCLPTGTDECFDLQGRETTTPTGMSAAIAASTPWNGPAVAVGPRVYVPDGEGNGDVECFDYATSMSCPGFPKDPEGLGGLYTVNADPQRPTCIWINSDHGEHQIQNFDAYTGEGCGQGTIRALTTQFAVAKPECAPASYVSVQVLKPARSSYASGSVAFENGDGAAIAGLEPQPLNAEGTASLEGLELNTSTGLPQFLFNLTGESDSLGTVEVQLNWNGDYNARCVTEKIKAVRHPAPIVKTERPKAAPPKTTTTKATTTPPKTTSAKPHRSGSCTGAELELVDVGVRGSKVELSGKAHLSLSGRRIVIRFLATGRTVASAVVQRNGTFAATAPLPPPGLRETNLARYQAVAGNVRSLPLKLFRRMYITSVRRVGQRLLLSGRVSGSFKADTPVTIHSRVACAKEATVGQTSLTRAGTFSASVPLPPSDDAGLTTYRASTDVLWGSHPELTYTLPEPAPLG